MPSDMLHIPDRISMDDLSKLWIERALKALETELEMEEAAEGSSQGHSQENSDLQSGDDA